MANMKKRLVTHAMRKNTLVQHCWEDCRVHRKASDLIFLLTYTNMLSLRQVSTGIDNEQHLQRV